jgi:hypothetical protein
MEQGLLMMSQCKGHRRHAVRFRSCNYEIIKEVVYVTASFLFLYLDAGKISRGKRNRVERVDVISI